MLVIVNRSLHTGMAPMAQKTAVKRLLSKCKPDPMTLDKLGLKILRL